MKAITPRQRQYGVAIRALPDVWQNQIDLLSPVAPFMPADGGSVEPALGITERYRDRRREAGIFNLTHVVNLLNTTLLGQDTLYGDPGQVQAVDQTQFGEQVTRQRRTALAARPQQLFSDLSWLINTSLLGQDSFYGDPGQSQPLNETMFGTQVVRQRRQAFSEKQYLHAQFDIEDWTFERIQEDESLKLNLLAPPDWTQFGSGLSQQRRRAYSEKPYLHAQSDLSWLITWTLVGQDTFYAGPGQVIPHDWTQFGVPLPNPRMRVRSHQHHIWAYWPYIFLTLQEEIHGTARGLRYIPREVALVPREQVMQPIRRGVDLIP